MFTLILNKNIGFKLGLDVRIKLVSKMGQNRANPAWSTLG